MNLFTETMIFRKLFLVFGALIFTVDYAFVLLVWHPHLLHKNLGFLFRFD